MTLIPPPPYSQDVLLCDFFLFLELKMALKGRRFNITMIRAKVGDGVADFQTMHIMKCFEWWHDCCTPCVKPQKDYFQGITGKCCYGEINSAQKLFDCTAATISF
jgi:hypothetical protein